MAGRLSLRSGTNEVPVLVRAPVTVLVPVPETVVAVRLIVLSLTDEMLEILRVPVTLLDQVRRQVWR